MSKRTSKSSPKRGRFIVLDGPDGAGKSTQVQLLTEQLEKRGHHTLALREPGGTTAGEVIRSLLLERRQDRLTPVAETFLFQAARAQLVDEIIRPSLARGTWVICDRFTISTLVYQGYAGGVSPKEIERMSALATGGLSPDLYLVLWVPPHVGLVRRSNRSADRMESKGDDFLRAVSAGYKKALGLRRNKLTPIEAGGLVEDVRAQIWSHVERML